jgi:hypothetical protein
MKHIFIGDIHGKAEIVEEALQRDGLKVFVGDFLDSFDRSVDNQIRSLTLALDAVDKGVAKVIFGNHELSYLMPQQHRCSGYKAATDAHVIHLKERMWKTMIPFLKLPDNFIVTHAGVNSATIDHLDELEFANPDSPLHWIGRSRGGRAPTGGIFWCDFNREFVPIEGVNQIFGHTAKGGQEGIRRVGNNYCIDCLDHKVEFLELDL